jgi:hypothetical protein
MLSAIVVVGILAGCRFSFDIIDAGPLDANPDDTNTGDTNTDADTTPVPPLFSDPFGDGTAFAHVFVYRDRIYLGPRENGRGAVRLASDGMSLEAVDFAFAQDVNPAGGSTSSNISMPPYPSVGATGCMADTSDCGPDNEDGRGMFAPVTLGGEERLFLGGARSLGDLDYVYTTVDADVVLDMAYIDLTTVTGPQTRGFSAVGSVADRVFLGLPDTGGRRPYLVMLTSTPAGPPGMDARQNGLDIACDPSLHDACHMAAELMPGIGRSGSPPNAADTVSIDFVVGFHDRVYIGNNGGLVRSTTPSPLDYLTHPEHWESVTPTAAEYSAASSITSDKTSDLEPRDRAWVGLAEHGARLYFARNTTAGPQLWACDPTVISSPAPATVGDCDPGDFSLVLGDGGNPNNSHLAMIGSSGSYLIFGFDNGVDGLIIYRTANPAPTSIADFEGQGACTAGTAGCEGLGGNGLGSPMDNTRIFSSAIVSVSGEEFLYLASGDGVNPVRVYRTPL